MDNITQTLTSLADDLEIDEEMLKEILILFFENMPGQISAMKSHASNKELSDIHVISHTIKGTSANLHYEDISKTAADIETLALSGNHTFEAYDALFNKLSLQLAHAKMQIFYK